jgi:DNA-binding CsgD family transcriptional regulator
MHEGLIDRIYEAAFQPDCWPDVLNEVGASAGSHAGVLFVFDDMRPVRHKATPLVAEVAQFSADHWRESPRVSWLQKKPMVGFFIANSHFPAELMGSDPCRSEMVAAGLDSEIIATVPLPTGELLAYGFPRLGKDGSHGEADVQALNTLLPHLARAGLMSARLGVEHARGTTRALHAIGLPAAVLTSNGLVLSANPLFEAMTDLFLPVAFGRLAVADVGANRLLQSAIEGGFGDLERVRSVPVAATDSRGACVIHILPVRHSANDLFPGGDLILAVSGVRKSALVPSPQVLMGLFDLTPAEVRFASGLIAGASVQEVSASLGIAASSGRTFLARIFDKTGTHRQSELLSLLASTHPFT